MRASLRKGWVSPGSGRHRRRADDPDVGLRHGRGAFRSDRRGASSGCTRRTLRQRRGVARGQLRDDPPSIASPRKMLVVMLNPDKGTPLPPRLLDEAADVRGDRGTLVRHRDDAVLHADDEESCVLLIRDGGHALPSLTVGTAVPVTVGVPTSGGRPARLFARHDRGWHVGPGSGGLLGGSWQHHNRQGGRDGIAPRARWG